MLRAGWWPASLKRPRTGFTLRTLEFFQALSLLSKTNGYDFWRTIVYMTDGSGTLSIPVSLSPKAFIIFSTDVKGLTPGSYSKGTKR